MQNENIVKSRDSSIELLKIIGIFLIVISHVIQCLHTPNEFIKNQEYILDISVASASVQRLILAMLRSSGAFGNTIFFICSAWFLLESKRINKRKILYMIADVLAVSIFILSVVYVIRGGDIPLKMVVKQFIPITVENNWYITCYLLFYPIHPFLNLLIERMTQKTLLRTTCSMSFLYIGVNFVKDGHYFTSSLILWITIYFIIAYIKYYLVEISNNMKINGLVFGVGFIGNYGIVWLTNVVGMNNAFFSDKILRWGTNTSPFIIMMVISLLNFARNINIQNKGINYLAKLSLLIYIIHENILLRTYYRPLLWQWIYHNWGYDKVLIWVMLLAILIFLFGILSSVVYKYTIQIFVVKSCNLIYPILCCIYEKIENKIMLLK